MDNIYRFVCTVKMDAECKECTYVCNDWTEEDQWGTEFSKETAIGKKAVPKPAGSGPEAPGRVNGKDERSP